MTSDAPKTDSVARPASRVSLAVMCSRVLGLLRESIFAALFGTGLFADAYVFAFRIPNLLRDFFAEGALSSAFVPTFASVRKSEGDARAFALARRVMGTLATCAVVITLLGIVFAPFVVSVVAWKAEGATREHTILLTRIMFPFLIAVALAAVVAGVLNTYHRYFVPAIASAALNVILVLGGVVLLAFGSDLTTASICWAILVVVGGLAQLLVQLPSLRSVGFRGRPTLDMRLRDPHLKQVVRRMGPVVLSLAATNIMLVITTGLASQTKGWASSLSFAFRLVHLPIGIVGVALGTVLLAAGSHRSAASDDAGLDGLIRRGIRLNWFLTLPAAVGLFTLAEPIVRMLYQHGEFMNDSTLQVARVLRWYAGGIVFYAGVKAAAPHFLARGDTRTPMWCSVMGIAVNIAVALLLIDLLGIAALALSVCAGAATNYFLLRYNGIRRFGAGSVPPWHFVFRCIVAAAAMGLCAWGLTSTLLAPDRDLSFFVRVVLTVGGAAVLALFYFVVAALLGVAESRAFLSRMPWWRSASR